MWETWTASQKMRCRPSDLLRLSDGVLAYYFDRAVWTFGSAIQSEMDEAERKSKSSKSLPARQRMILNKWVPPPGGATAKGRFKDPAAGSIRG